MRTLEIVRSRLAACAVRRAGLATAVAFAWAAAATGAAAQTVRGVVTSRAGGAPLAGAVVMLVDATSGDAASTDAPIAARALSDEAGAFILRAPHAGSYVFRARRLGFAPLMIGGLVVQRDTTLAVVMAELAAPLPAVLTRDRNECRVRPDSGLATYALWEDAKTALLAASITRDDHAYRFDAVDQSRLWDLTNDSLRDVSLGEQATAGRDSWLSRTPAQLARFGYVTADSTTLAFVAPDIDVLLSPYFTAEHCFRVDDRARDDSLIGLAFEPVAESPHVEIRGTLWLDRASHRLQSLSYEYTNVPHTVADTLPGGRVDFARLATGGWVIASWAIRVPADELAGRGGPAVGLYGVRRTGTFENMRFTNHDGREEPERLVRVMGGDLRSVRRDSAVIWSGPAAQLSVLVTAAVGTGETPVRDAIVRVLGSPIRATTDSTGRAYFATLAPGSYLIGASSRALDLLGTRESVARADLYASRPIEVRLKIQPDLAAARDACGPNGPVNAASGVAMGVVTRDGAPVGARTVAAAWPAADALDGEQRIETRTSPDGIFALCGVPRNAPFQVLVAGTTRTERFAAGEVVREVNIALARSAALR
jgi:hypothetical protein